MTLPDQDRAQVSTRLCRCCLRQRHREQEAAERLDVFTNSTLHEEPELWQR